jgi:SAM-dependent methyltransferase
MGDLAPFAGMARFYDRIYAFKDYRAEADKVAGFIRQSRRSGGSRLLDVACGTGLHLEHLCSKFDCEGLDISEDMLAEARKRLPEIVFTRGNMPDFDLGRRFDAVTNLFSSIGYMTTPEMLERAVANMARHLEPGGVLLVEPWITPEAWLGGMVSVETVDEPELKVVRVARSWNENRMSHVHFRFTVATREAIESFDEFHALRLYTVEEMQAAFRRAGLETSFDEQGISGRGLHIGVRP